MKEIWRDVIGYEEYKCRYKISNYGRIKSVRTGKIINQSNKSYIALRNKEKRKSVSVKELLYTAFSENIELIKKDIKFNYWHKNKLIEPTYEYKNAGKHKRILVICVTTGKKFDSIEESNRFYNIKAGAIMRCCKGIRKSAGKIILDDGTEYKLAWRYLDKND